MLAISILRITIRQAPQLEHSPSKDLTMAQQNDVRLLILYLHYPTGKRCKWRISYRLNINYWYRINKRQFTTNYFIQIASLTKTTQLEEDMGCNCLFRLQVYFELSGLIYKRNSPSKGNPILFFLFSEIYKFVWLINFQYIYIWKCTIVIYNKHQIRVICITVTWKDL